MFGKTLKEHHQNLKAVFQRLKEKGLTLNKSKCEFRKDKLEFFVYMFSKDGISPDPKIGVISMEIKRRLSITLDSLL